MRLFLFLITAVAFLPFSARAEEVRYFDFPEGTKIRLSRTPDTTSKAASASDEWLTVSPRATLTVTGRELGTTDAGTGVARSAGVLKGLAQWFTSDGQKRTANDVYVPESDTRRNPLQGKDISVDFDMSRFPEEADCDPFLRQIARLRNSLKLNQHEMGKCLEAPAQGNLFDALKRRWEPEMKGSPEKQLGGQGAFAVDALARTLYGEMRGCYRKGLRYPGAVARVLFNRATDISNNGCRDSFVRCTPEMKERMKQSGIAEIMPHLVSSRSQFTVWNRGDANNRHVLCLDTNTKEWKQSVEIARRIITHDPDLLNLTNDVKARHYTSGIDAPKSWKATEMKNVTVGGTPLDDPKCLRFWNVPVASNK